MVVPEAPVSSRKLRTGPAVHPGVDDHVGLGHAEREGNARDVALDAGRELQGQGGIVDDQSAVAEEPVTQNARRSQIDGRKLQLVDHEGLEVSQACLPYLELVESSPSRPDRSEHPGPLDLGVRGQPQGGRERPKQDRLVLTVSGVDQEVVRTLTVDPGRHQDERDLRAGELEWQRSGHGVASGGEGREMVIVHKTMNNAPGAGVNPELPAGTLRPRR